MASLLILAMLSLLLLVTLYVLFRRQSQGGLAGGQGSNSPPRMQASSGKGRRISADEVAKHNTPDDIWLIIRDKVYDFTEYLPLHPGGEAILRNAGADSTSGFSGPQHPTRVWQMVSAYSILIARETMFCQTDVHDANHDASYVMYWPC